MAAARRGEVVVITGASAGVGRATAEAFARRGARIGLIARGTDRLEAARRDVEALGGTALVLPADVADAEAIEEAAARVEWELGPIDVWVNNAMAAVFSPIKELTAEEIRRVTDVTYLGYVHGTLAALRRMLPRDRGTIVQVGSALAYRSIPLQAAYCAAKHAIAGFTASLRCELIHDGSHVRVTEVQMPALNTPQFSWVKSRLPRKAQPVPPIYQPEVAAEAIYWAAHHRRRELLVGWSTVQAVWGNKLVPGLIDRYLARTGYEGQQYDGPEDPGRPDNLWAPAPGSQAAHGDFDDRASERCLQLWATTHRSWLALAGAGTLGAAWAAARSRRSRTARRRTGDPTGVVRRIPL
jgi:short-subunit dehydrogenase